MKSLRHRVGLYIFVSRGHCCRLKRILSQERQSIIKYWLDNLRAKHGEALHNIHFLEGQPISEFLYLDFMRALRSVCLSCTSGLYVCISHSYLCISVWITWKQFKCAGWHFICCWRFLEVKKFYQSFEYLFMLCVCVSERALCVYVPVPELRARGVIQQVFPLHEQRILGQLMKSWVQAVCEKQPLG